MRVFMLDDIALLPAAKIAIQCVDPWAEEVYCSIEDYAYNEFKGERLVFIAPRRGLYQFDPDVEPEPYRRAMIVPDRSVPPGEIHVPIPTPATERY